ncbi:MAG: amino acid ABC transporter permease, partial [Chloroflexi bacterium]|nr:amino acid ABC transporter permease [Chloroflexota bacterium]
MTSWEKWKPFLDPEILTFLLGGLWLTLQVAVASVILSIVFGTVLAMLRLAKLPPVAWPAMAYVETVRSLPSFLVLIYVFFGVNRLGFKLPPEAAVVVGLTAYSAAKVAEIVRAGIQSIEKGQIEASRSLGLSYLQTMRYVVLPQAFRRMVPPLVGELVIVIKNTSIGVAVGLNELLRRGQITYQEFLNPVETLVVV